MKAVRQHEAGGQLFVEEINIPVPAHGEVLIKIDAAPINPSDLSFIDGKYGSPNNFPVTPGIEGSGRVIGSGGGIIARMRLGKRVACSAIPGKDGTWAEYMVTSATRCIPLSKKISSEQGSMMIVNPMTALSLMDIARKDKHKAIVNTAAASALGKMLIELCKSREIPLINIVRSDSQVEKLKKLGSEYVMNSNDDGFTRELTDICLTLEATLILEAVGGKTGSQVIEAAPENSRIILYAKMEDENIQLDSRNLIRKQNTIEGFYLANYVGNIKLVRKLNLIRLTNVLMKSMDPVVVQAIFTLGEVTEACETYRSSMSKGKVLLKP